jgi:O-antigen/teichoic acid export membrane protein
MTQWSSLVAISNLHSDSRGLIRSMLVIGSAQFVNILISIIRMKVLAVLLGPSGVGLLSIYNSLLGMVQQTAGLGIGSSGVREPTVARMSLVEAWDVWKPMAKLGAAFMLGGLATAATLLLVRGLISKELGLDAAGYFAAAWNVTMTYVGFLLGAMGADYYPRLKEVIHDKVAAVRLMNDQAQLGLAIGGPVLLLLIGLAPWVITLLYASAFEPAVTLLQWQMLGNVFKLASWALAFSIVAAARGKTFFLMELSFNIVFLGMVFIFLPQVGLEVTAYAFVLGYLVYLTIVYVLARSIHGFRWQALSLGLLGLHTGLGVALLVLAVMAPLAEALASPLLATATGLFGLCVVLSKVGKHGRLPTRVYGIFARLGWPIQSAV